MLSEKQGTAKERSDCANPAHLPARKGCRPGGRFQFLQHEAPLHLRPLTNSRLESGKFILQDDFIRFRPLREMNAIVGANL